LLLQKARKSVQEEKGFCKALVVYNLICNPRLTKIRECKRILSNFAFFWVHFFCWFQEFTNLPLLTDMIMAKKIFYDQQARRHLKAGMDLLADSIAATLGPRGRYVVIEKKHEPPLITRDGSEVARNFSLKGRFAELGINLLRRVASRAGKEAGDGVSTAILLARCMVDAGMKNLEAGAHPMELKAGIDLAVDRAVVYLKDMGKPVRENSPEIGQVAAVAANQDRQVGGAVAGALKKTGANGLITIEEGKGRDSHIEMKEGMQFDRGFISPFFITDMVDMEAVLEDPFVLIYDKKVHDTRDLLPVLNECASQGSGLLIIAEGVDEQPLTTLVLNKIRGTLKVAAVRAPGFGDQRRDMMEDIAAFTSGTVLAAEKGNLL